MLKALKTLIPCPTSTQLVTVGQDLSGQAAQAALPDSEDEEEGQLDNAEEEDDAAASASSEGEAVSEAAEEEDRMAEVSMPESKLHGGAIVLFPLASPVIQLLIVPCTQPPNPTRGHSLNSPTVNPLAHSLTLHPLILHPATH